MTEYYNDELILRIKTPHAKATLCQLIKAIAASMRWATQADKTEADEENIFYMASFLEEITPDIAAQKTNPD